MTEKDAEELLQGSMDQKRHNTDPTTADGDASADVEAAIQDAFEAIDSGDVPPNVSVRDENLAALLRGLEDANELHRVANQARTELDRSTVEEANRSQTVSDLARVGLSVVADDVLESGKAAREQYIRKKSREDEF